MRRTSTPLLLQDFGVLVVMLFAASLPCDVDAQERSKRVFFEQYEANYRIALNELADAQQKLMSLVNETRPVVRSPDALVEELARIERDVFDSQLQFLALQGHVESTAEKLERLKKQGVSVGQRLERQRAETKLVQARAVLTAKRAESDRLRKLAADAVVPQFEVQQAELELQQHEAQVQLAEGELEALAAQTDTVLSVHANELAERTEEMKRLKLSIQIREKRAEELKAIFDECFQYQKLSRSKIPSLEAEIVELEAKLRYFNRSKGGEQSGDAGSKGERSEVEDPNLSDDSKPSRN